MWYTIGVIVVICSLLTVWFRDIEDVWYYLKKIVLFVPIIILAILIHVATNFKTNKTGYILLFLLIAFILYGVIMGIEAGPSSPAPWE